MLLTWMRKNVVLPIEEKRTSTIATIDESKNDLSCYDDNDSGGDDEQTSFMKLLDGLELDFVSSSTFSKFPSCVIET